MPNFANAFSHFRTKCIAFAFNRYFWGNPFIRMRIIIEIEVVIQVVLIHIHQSCRRARVQKNNMRQHISSLKSFKFTHFAPQLCYSLLTFMVCTMHFSCYSDMYLFTQLLTGTATISFAWAWTNAFSVGCWNFNLMCKKLVLKIYYNCLSPPICYSDSQTRHCSSQYSLHYKTVFESAVSTCYSN